MPFGPAELKDILSWGGAPFLLLILLLGAIAILWRQNISLQAKLEDTQKQTVSAGREIILAIERSTVVTDQLTRTENQRTSQLATMLQRAVDQLGMMDRQITELRSTTLQNEPFQETVRVRYETLRREMRELTADVMQALSEVNDQHRRWQDTVRNLVDNATTEVRSVKELLAKRQR